MSAKQKDVGSSPALGQFFSAGYFGFVRFVLQIFLMSPKAPPLNFFLFCKRMDVQKLPKGLFYIFRHYATYRRPKRNSKKFSEIF